MEDRTRDTRDAEMGFNSEIINHQFVTARRRPRYIVRERNGERERGTEEHRHKVDIQ